MEWLSKLERVPIRLEFGRRLLQIGNRQAVSDPEPVPVKMALSCA